MYFSTYLLPPQQRLFALAADVGSVALETLRLKICKAETYGERRCDADPAELTSIMYRLQQLPRSFNEGNHTGSS